MKVNQFLTTEIVIATTTVSLLTVLGMYWFHNRRKNAVPHKWKPVGKVKNLFIYPIKSARGTEIKTALCTEFGLQFPKLGEAYQLRDRNFIVFKENDNNVHRSPEMVLIETTVWDENHVILTAPGISQLKIKLPNMKDANKPTKASMWEDESIFTIDCGDEAAKWLSNYLLKKDSGLRLGFYDHRHRRDIKKAFRKYLKVYPKLGNETTGMYSNLTSYMLLAQASLDDLLSKLPGIDVTVNNFRPNILIDGEDISAFAEDNWKWVKIGPVILYFVKPCTRCDFITVNPETATKYPDNEPLRTLRKYRLLKDVRKIELDGNRSVMGINMSLHKGGNISVGDTVYVGEV